MKYGLKKLKKDTRDFQVGKIYRLPDIETLPEEFDIGEVKIKDQRDTDYCSAYASCLASEFQEGVQLLPEWSFAVSKVISGDVESYGQDLRTAMKAHVKYGAVENGNIPANPRYIKNWPYLFDEAKKHKKESYFKVVGSYDHFDNIRASMFLFAQQKRAVVFGMKWSYNLSSVIIDKPAEGGGGHALCAIGWKGEYLKVANSYGKKAGENGIHYIHRDVINENIDNYGAFMFIDIDPETVKRQWTFWQKVINFFIKLLK